MTPSTSQDTWQLERRWHAYNADGELSEKCTAELLFDRAVVMLGAAGSGKTIESKRLAELERAAGKDVRFCRLAEYTGSSEELARYLGRLAEGATDKTVIYLDALDEAMIPLRRSWITIRNWLSDVLRDTGASIRITCRSAVWPGELTDALSDYAGDGGITKATLQQLTDSDIRIAACAYGVDPDSFVTELVSCRAETLARLPLTLRMLLGLFAESQQLPSTLAKLFEDGMLKLAADSSERFSIDTAISISPNELLSAAERLACYTVLTGQELINTGDDAAEGSLHWVTLSALDDGTTRLDRNTLRAIGSSGICDSESPATFRFGHRQFAEYLAGRRLAKMLLHQSRALLASPAGWKCGVAGPLRETAAFAAMSSNELASWLAHYDPEVVGLSDVADTNLRRTATLGLLDSFRQGRMTDAQVSRGELESRGFQYPDAENDLRPVLRERGSGCEDFLECAIEFIESWRLTSMSDDLADLALDPTAPQHSRIAAAYALNKFGSDEACDRLKPLIAGVSGDEHDQLKGLAIRCNWPERLSVPELLKALTPRSGSSFTGAYEGMLWELEHSGFCAESYRAEGLRWAKGHVSSHGDIDWGHRIVVRIAHAALHELDDPDVLVALVELLQHCAARHIASPLCALRKSGFVRHDDEPEIDAPLASQRVNRRKLIDALVAASSESQNLWWLGHRTPGFYILEDFPWLLERGCDESYSLASRTHYLEIARWLPWKSRSEYVDTWLAVQKRELVQSVFSFPLFIDLNSDSANIIRNNWKMMNERPARNAPAQLEQPPHERVQICLHLAESKDPRFFFNLCQDLTLETSSTYYGIERFLTRSPGWMEADGETRSRIVYVAKRFLTSDVVDTPEIIRGMPLKSSPADCMAAIWLVLEIDSSWLEAREIAWWRRWCWYIIRELHPNLMGEYDQQLPKRKILSMLYRAAPECVRTEIVQLATQDNKDADNILRGLLEMLGDISDPELDANLCRRIIDNEIRNSCLGTVMQFVLSRDTDKGVPICASLLSELKSAEDESPAVVAAVSLLYESPSIAWEDVSRFVQTNEQHGQCVLRQYAHGTRYRNRDNEGEPPLKQLSVSQLGELAGMYLQLFPLESDPHYEGAHYVGPDDSARHLRDQLISGLGKSDSFEAVEAIRTLEQRFGAKYTWLRRPRARAERSYRLSQWVPIPESAISSMLASQEKRLIRSEEDVLNGIEAALESYSIQIRQDGSVNVNDLWDRPSGLPPSPKEEEHISSKICGAVREYFERYAITADREVEIHRRTIPEANSGNPGSELDILVQSPAHGNATGVGIRVPIEVKLSSNKQAKAGMKDQLVDRYIPQLGATHGLYVVVWMSVPDPSMLSAHHRPKWITIEKARSELNTQAELLSKTNGIHVRGFVIDAALI